MLESKQRSRMKRKTMTTTAHIFQIAASHGGVPKLAQGEADVTTLGLGNDKQANLAAHGGPNRAICLYALERILSLQEEGHHIFPGSTGENVTIVGLDWQTVAPGVRLQLGDEVVLEVTGYTKPCSKITASFADSDTSRIAQEKHAGWSRVYARVAHSGRIRVGDSVRLL
jgi:MOSC domain-containing protein YiiM